MSDVTIKINGKEYKLLITLGFWKNLSFKRSEWDNASEDIKKLSEAIELAIFYGNKKTHGWNCLEDMKKEISEDDFNDIDVDVTDILGKAFLNHLPEKVRNKVLQKMEDHENPIKKK